ncbi:MAG: PfkB family carbohydrate kinase, partial [archaeon]|nr:PfkB family carbohydrate kinase [archaeon]
MPKVVIVGSLALDDVKTPFGEVKSALGGSATFASLACSLFSETGIVGVVGEDFPKEHLELFKSKGIDVSGIEIRKGKKTFHWEGEYSHDLNTAITKKTDLNVLETFNPKLSEEFKEADFLFLGNIDPELQLNVLSQMKKRPGLVIADTMNLWIDIKR